MTNSLVLLSSSFVISSFGQGTAFTYQGRLNDGVSPAQGIYDLRFTIYDASGGGSQHGPALTNAATSVSNGLFTVTLDFGNQFPGAERWLEIGVRTNGGGAFSVLSPRQQLTSTPHAIQAAHAALSSSVSGPVSAAQLTGTISPNNIGAGTISTPMLAEGAVGSAQLAAGAVITGAIADGAVIANKVGSHPDPGGYRKIICPEPASAERFGSSLALLGGDRLIVGTPRFRIGPPYFDQAGKAFLLSSSGEVLARFENPQAHPMDDYFGQAVAAVGADYVAIGAPFENQGAEAAGIAYLFATNGLLVATVTNPAPSPSGQFGTALAAVGSDRLLVGAPFGFTPISQAGKALLVRTNGSLLATLTAPAPHVGALFGVAVASVGTDALLVAEPNHNGSSPAVGAVYLFNTNGTLIHTFTNPAPGAYDHFGSSIAALGSDRVLIGARMDNLRYEDGGAAYLFHTNGTLLTAFTNPTTVDLAFGSQFGCRVAVAGPDRILIAATNFNSGRGAVHVFDTNAALIATFLHPEPQTGAGFGASLAAWGEGFAVGAEEPSSDGAVYGVSGRSFVPGLMSDGVRAGSINNGMLMDGAVTAAKISGELLPSQIPNLDASKIVSGVIGDARLSTNVSLLGQAIESAEITDGTIVNADINSSAAIADTKLATLSTAGKVADSALSANIALRVGGNVFSGLQQLLGTARVHGADQWDVNNTEGDFRVGSDTHRFKIGVAQGGGGAGDVWMRAQGGTARLFLKTPGGTTIYSNEGQTSGVSLAVGGGAWTTVSDRNAKENFQPVDAQQVLAKVAALPLSQWNYKSQETSIRHLGPMAQDFRAAFGLGESDTGITTVDADGVALAAIQGLNQKLEQKETEITELKQQMAELKALVEKLANEQK